MSPKLSDHQKEQRNVQILQAAKRVFGEKGYGAATLKDIVEEAGMSRGWIYLYYQTKEEIFEALLDLQDEQHEQYIEELIHSSSSIWEVITTLYSQQLEELLRDPLTGLHSAFYEYFLVRSRDEGRRALLMKRYDTGIARFARLLQLGVERGEFAPNRDVMDISRLAASYQEGITTHAITVGAHNAKTAMQFDALTAYLNVLLRPVPAPAPVPASEAASGSLHIPTDEESTK